MSALHEAQRGLEDDCQGMGLNCLRTMLWSALGQKKTIATMKALCRSFPCVWHNFEFQMANIGGERAPIEPKKRNSSYGVQWMLKTGEVVCREDFRVVARAERAPPAYKTRWGWLLVACKSNQGADVSQSVMGTNRYTKWWKRHVTPLGLGNSIPMVWCRHALTESGRQNSTPLRSVQGDVAERKEYYSGVITEMESEGMATLAMETPIKPL